MLFSPHAVLPARLADQGWWSVCRVTLTALLLTSCTDSDARIAASPDAGLPDGVFTLTISRPSIDERFDVLVGETLFEGSRDEPESVSYLFDEGLDTERTIEVTVILKETGLIVDRRTLRSNCLLDLGFWGPLWREDLRLRLSVTGKLTHGGSTCRSRNGGVGVTENGDPLCELYFDTCSEGRCGFRQVSADPELVQYTCTDPGSIPVGEACTFGQPGLENFDDCEAGTGCIEGICRRFCYAQYPITTCDTVPEVPCIRLPEFGEARMGYCGDE